MANIFDTIKKAVEWMPQWKKESGFDPAKGSSSTDGGGIPNIVVKEIVQGELSPDVLYYFIDLQDVPATYVGQGGKTVKVNVAETALEFGAASTNRCVSLVIYGSATSVKTGNGIYGIAIPGEIEGYLLSEATGAVHTKGVTGSMTIQVRRRRAGVDADMLNTKITLADVYYNTTTDILAASDDVSEGDLIFVDVDTIHTTAAKGLSVVLTFVAP